MKDLIVGKCNIMWYMIQTVMTEVVIIERIILKIVKDWSRISPRTLVK